MPTKLGLPLLLAVGSLALSTSPPTAAANTNTLKIYLMAGQSNMEGQGYTWDNFATVDNWNVPSLDYLSGASPASKAYLASLPESVYGFKQAFDASWMGARNDAWSVNYLSSNGKVLQVRTTRDTTPGDDSLPAYPVGIQPLSPGFGKNGSIGSRNNGTNMTPSYFGLELGMGHNLGDAMQSPLLLFKSSKGGTTLAVNWRPPSAAADRGGNVGSHYINTINRFKGVLDGLDADLANGVLDDKYGGASGYEVAGFVWMQGWNEQYNQSGGPTSAQMIAEYAHNMVDLVEDIRASDNRIPNNMPAIIVESADQNPAINAQRLAAANTLNAEKAGSAVFLEMNNLIDGHYGGLNASGNPFNKGYGSHFHVRPENYLEIGWRVADTIIENNFTGSETVPEPTTLAVLAAGTLAMLRRKRRTP
ncbi:MAG: PEP-CTERM sorting domain-containing protein [Phycisphaerae bacterium]|nr:PEP-CTERM sorting domain-containing protein [Phycisphaerae bacterium]